MPRGQNSYTTEEVLAFFDGNYGVPGGGECSDISDMDDEVEDMDLEVNNACQIDEESANDEFDFDDIHQINVVDAERPIQGAGRPPVHDFSPDEWSDDFGRR